MTKVLFPLFGACIFLAIVFCAEPPSDDDLRADEMFDNIMAALDRNARLENALSLLAIPSSNPLATGSYRAAESILAEVRAEGNATRDRNNNAPDPNDAAGPNPPPYPNDDHYPNGDDYPNGAPYANGAPDPSGARYSNRAHRPNGSRYSNRAPRPNGSPYQNGASGSNGPRRRRRT